MSWRVIMLLSLTIPSVVIAQEELESTMNRLVAYDITARSLTGAKKFHEGLVGTSRLRRMDISRNCVSPAVTFYKVDVAITHTGISYTMAERDGQVLRIGGFTEPQVLLFAQWMGIEGASEKVLACASRSIAYLLAAAGSDSVLVIGPDTTFSEDLPTSWAGKPESEWVAGQSRIANDTWAVAVTTVGHNYSTDTWKPTHFVFLYSDEGTLLTWSLQTGELWR